MKIPASPISLKTVHLGIEHEGVSCPCLCDPHFCASPSLSRLHASKMEEGKYAKWVEDRKEGVNEMERDLSSVLSTSKILASESNIHEHKFVPLRIRNGSYPRARSESKHKFAPDAD